MNTVLLIIQLILAISLVGLILIQTSKGGLQTQVGGPDYYRVKRGAEKVVFLATIAVASLFLIITLINGLFR